MLFSGIAVAAVFVLRRREPAARAAVSRVGLSVGAGGLRGGSAAMLANELWRNPGTSAAGLGIIAAGVPVYWWMTPRAPTT